MDQPGFSLFQGGESIHVDGRAAEEEAEELLDRKRREKELGKVRMVQIGFSTDFVLNR